MLLTKFDRNGAQATAGRRGGLASRLAATSALALVASMAFAPGFAMAADDQADDVVLEEITVTARKVEENLQSVPVAVTAYSGEQLNQQNAVKIGDVSRFTPGLTSVSASSNPTALTISLRGQVQNDVLATLDPSVGTYVDGYYWSRAYGLNADLVDVSSVQVLKGPQGTLFGRNTTGGAFLLETHKPVLGEFSGTARLSIGNLNERIGSLVLNVPLGERAAVRGAVQVNKRDGTLTDMLNGKEYNNVDNVQGRLKVLFEPTDELQVVLSGEWFDYSSDGQGRVGAYLRQPVVASATQPAFASTARTYAALFPIPGLTLDGYLASVAADPDKVALDGDPFTETKTATYTGTLSLDTSIGVFKAIAGHRSVKSNNRLDLDGTPYAVHTTTLAQKLEQTSVEVQLTGQAFNDAVDYVVGALYFMESGTDASTTLAIPLLNPTTNYFLGDIDNENWGVYGQATYHVTEQLSVTGGLRYSADDKGITVGNRNVVRANGAVLCSMPGSIAPDCLANRSDKFNSTSYTFGVDYQVNPDVLVYAKTSRGYRSGGQNLRAVSPLTFQPFGPEIVKEHEIGFKSEWLDRRLRINAAAYMSELKGAQRSTLKGAVVNGQTTTFTLLENAARIETKGMEMEATAVLTSNFQVVATGAITKPEYKDFAEAPSAQNPTGDRTQERFVATPEKSFSIAAQYRQDFDFGRVSARVDYSWQDDYYSSEFNNPRDPNNAALIAATTTPSAGVWGARAAVALQDGKYEIAVWGRNIGDNRDYTSALLVDPFGYVSGQHRDPATYGVTATAKF